MTFVVTDLTRCAGQGHYQLSITVSGDPYVIHTTLAEFQLDFSDLENAEIRARIIDRCRSAIKEAGTQNNFSQARATLLANATGWKI